MLQGLVKYAGLSTWLQKSRSCVHILRLKGKTHCGRCPACVERRQAFSSAGIEEALSPYDTDVLIELITKRGERRYLSLLQLEAMKWENNATSSKRRMSNHLRLTEIPIEDDGEINE